MATFGLINMGVLPLLLEAMAPAYAQQAPQDHREQEARRSQQEQKPKPTQHESRPRPDRQEQPQKHERSPTKRPPQADRPIHPEPPRPQETRPQRPPPTVRPIPTVQPKRPLEQPKRLREIPTRPPEAQPVVTPRPPQERPAQQPPQPPSNTPAPQVQHGNLGQHSELWPSRRAQNWQAEHRSWQQRGGYTGYRIPTARYQSHFGPNHGFRMFSYQLSMFGGYPRFEYGGMWISVMDPWPEFWSNDWYGTDDLYIEYFGGGYYLRNRRHPADRLAITILVN